MTAIQKPKRGGFTLIELLVVISIIAILIGLLIPALQYVRCQTNEGAAADLMKEIETAMMMYEDDFGVPPPDMANGESSKFVKALKRKYTSRSTAYYSFSEKSLENGRVYSEFGPDPVHRSEIRYQRPRYLVNENLTNYTSRTPQNENVPDLWTMGCGETDEPACSSNPVDCDEVNNW